MHKNWLFCKPARSDQNVFFFISQSSTFLYFYCASNVNLFKEEEEEESSAPAAVQTSFAVKLEKFDAAKKVAVIKAVKSLVEGMNLVQAKKFVESAPAVMKSDIAKDEAEKIKETLAAAGAEASIE